MKMVAISSITFLLLLSMTQVHAQAAKQDRKPLKVLEGKEVSAVAKENFNVDFGNIKDVKWERLGMFDQARFMKSGVKTTAFYDIDGRLVGTSSPRVFADLPVKAQKEIKDKYKDYVIGAVIYYDDNEANETDMLLYNVQFDDEDNYFVELSKGTKQIVLKVDIKGAVTFFTQVK